jgi:Ni/Fe-hydrogenase 1 B-type cytochrome subunit
LDFAGVVLLVLVFLAMYIMHFGGNVITGRARKRFIEWQWSLHELPTGIRRFFHLVHAISILTLVVTGIYLRFPIQLPIGNRMGVKYLHYAAAIIATVFFVAAVLNAFISRNKPYKEFAFSMRDIKAALPTIKYYIFMASSKPHVANYNPLQKAIYGVMVPSLMVMQVATGFALLFSPQMLGWAVPLTGGLAIARVYTRLVHYIINWFFILFLAVHIYLTITEDLPGLLYLFFGIPPVSKGQPDNAEVHIVPGVVCAGLDPSSEDI